MARYKTIEIDEKGKYHLVPDADLIGFLSTMPWWGKLLDLPNPSEMDLSFLVKHHRQAKGITGRALAKLIGKDHKYVWNLENGKLVDPPEEEIMNQLRSALGERFIAAEALLKRISPKSGG